MSLTPVIHALKWLEFQELVRREPRRGYYAETISLNQIQEIYDLRKVVELSLLSETLKRLDEKTLLHLQAAL